MIIKASVLINADIDKVWAIFTDLTSWERWNTVLENVSVDMPKELAVGGKLNFCVRPFTVPVRLEAEVEEVLPGKRIVWVARKFGVLAKHEFLFEESADGVKVTSIEKFTGFKLAVAGFGLSKGRLRGLTATLLAELKNASENTTGSR
jgi:uncharacterized protein YndB with AHSA1/START domain